MLKQHPLDIPGIYYSQNLELLQALQSLEWDWLEIPDQYPFLRLVKGKGARRSVNSGALDKTRQFRIVVAVGRQDERALVLAYRKPGDFTCDSYRNFPQDPTSKPMEAVDTRILTGEIAAEESWKAIMNHLYEKDK